jgi:hypothetical protein
LCKIYSCDWLLKLSKNIVYLNINLPKS